MKRKRPLIIFDTSVILHQIVDLSRDKTGQIINHLTHSQLYERIQQGVNLYNSLFFLPGIDQRQCDILWVGDSTEGYWRRPWFNNWLDENPAVVEKLKEGFVEDITGEFVPISPTSRRKNLRIGYKASRDSCPYGKNAKKLINKISKAVVFPGYEADDVAAAATQVFPGKRIFLCTIDTDWLQLVDDRISWICMKGFSPQYRDVTGGMDWFIKAIEKDTKAAQEHMFDEADPLSLRHIVKWKMFSGDTSDNLPKGSPREVIDLLSPPFKHRLWQDSNNRRQIRESLVKGRSPKVCLKLQDEAFDFGIMPMTPPVHIDWNNL
jgi:hypothetical protein